MSVAQSAMHAPVVKIAAGAVIILCAVGVGAMTGLIPGVSSQDEPAQSVAAEPANSPVSAPVPAEKAAPKRAVAKESAAREPVRTAAAAPVCADCGIVQSVQAVEVKGEASGAGAIVGGVAGLVVGNQIGSGKGKTLAKVAGAAGGAYAGHQIEKNMKKAVQYQVTVRMNDGALRTVSQPTDAGLTAGTRVKVVGDTVVRDAS